LIDVDKYLRSGTDIGENRMYWLSGVWSSSTIKVVNFENFAKQSSDFYE